MVPEKKETWRNWRRRDTEEEKIAHRFNGEAIASASVQDKIRQIIESEDPKRPYSDDKISQLLKEENISIARRTVAKYREIMRVLPSNKRKQF
jgi:RNA polymerase sigma-54 factor